LSLTDALQHRVVPAHLLVEIGLKGLHANLACLLELELENVVLATRTTLVGAQINAHLEARDIVGRPNRSVSVFRELKDGVATYQASFRLS
jgi:hypothetical protein